MTRPGSGHCIAFFVTLYLDMILQLLIWQHRCRSDGSQSR